jgi:hypothetical protein
VPQESIVEIKGCEGAVRDWKTPSAIVERQMFPRQTNRTETGLGDLESLIVAIWEVSWSCVGRLGRREVPLRLSVVGIRGCEESGKIGDHLGTAYRRDWAC